MVSQRIPKPQRGSSNLPRASSLRTTDQANGTGKPLSRQQRYQLRHKEQGLCVKCSNKARKGYVHCAKHHAHYLERARAKAAAALEVANG